MDDYLENKDWKAETGFIVPDNYFNDLSEEINSKITTERLKIVAATDGYSVPEGYFEQLEQRILDRVKKNKNTSTKVVRLWHSNLFKYVSAACLVMVAAFGLYFSQSNPANPIEKNSTSLEIANEQLLYDIDEQMIIEHIEATNADETTTNATNKELESYILNNYSQSEIARNL